MKTFYPFLFLLTFLLLHIFFTPFTLVVAGDDSKCENSPTHPTSPGLGGTCQWGLRDATTCKVGTTPGTVVPDKCFSDSSSNYRCCVPQPEKDCVGAGGECVRLSGGQDCHLSNGREGRVIEFGCPEGRNCCMPKDPVRRDVGCANAGGTCRWTSSLNDCAGGCYVFGLCRAEAQTFRDGKYYVCCVTNEEFCDGDTDYTKWGDVYPNGDCPFSKPSKSNDKIGCSQGVETGSHNSKYNKPSIDVPLTKKGSNGSEYFIAPDNGEIIFAQAYYINNRPDKGNIIIPEGKPFAGQVQRCGCVVRLKTDKGIVYEIRHCLLFAGISKYFLSDGTKDPDSPKVSVFKGEIIGRIADDTDTNVVNHVSMDDTCTNFEHFHVKVTMGDVSQPTDGSGGLDRCIDCHFVDHLGCNLRRYDFGEGSEQPSADKCGRCNRSAEMPNCFGKKQRLADWGGVECDKVNEGCAGCNNETNHYCCETDKVECCIEDDEGNKICEDVCECPHPSPGGVGQHPM